MLHEVLEITSAVDHNTYDDPIQRRLLIRYRSDSMLPTNTLGVIHFTLSSSLDVGWFQISALLPRQLSRRRRCVVAFFSFFFLGESIAM